MVKDFRKYLDNFKFWSDNVIFRERINQMIDLVISYKYKKNE